MTAPLRSSPRQRVFGSVLSAGLALAGCGSDNNTVNDSSGATGGSPDAGARAGHSPGAGGAGGAASGGHSGSGANGSDTGGSSADGIASGAAAGATTTGGATSSGGNGGSGGGGEAAGTGNAGGSSGASNGSGAAGGSTQAGGPGTALCGAAPVTVSNAPLGCDLAWGTNGEMGDRSSYLDFITTWVGYEANGGLGSAACDGCNTVKSLASKPAFAAYYAYFIGFQANADGFGDCNLDFDGKNLCTHGAQWVRDNRAELVQMYADYAKKTEAASPNKAVLWLLEGDFVQYTYAEQTNKLSLAELGSLATDIVCAIKSNEPKALVGIDHSAWLADDVTDSFWKAMPVNLLDFIWTTGVGNNGGLINKGAKAGDYNGKTARYSYLHQLTGKGVIVDTSFGASQAADSWSNIASTDLSARVSEGIIGVNVTQPPADYASRISGFAGKLAPVCK